MKVVDRQGRVIRFVSRETQAECAKREAREALKRYLETPDDLITLKETIKIVKHLSQLIVSL